MATKAKKQPLTLKSLNERIDSTLLYFNKCTVASDEQIDEIEARVNLLEITNTAVYDKWYNELSLKSTHTNVRITEMSQKLDSELDYVQDEVKRSRVNRTLIVVLAIVTAFSLAASVVSCVFIYGLLN